MAIDHEYIHVSIQWGNIIDVEKNDKPLTHTHTHTHTHIKKRDGKAVYLMSLSLAEVRLHTLWILLDNHVANAHNISVLACFELNKTDCGDA